MTPVTCRQFWGYTVALLTVWLIVLSAASEAQTLDVTTRANAIDREVQHARNCKALCGDCGCMGFYCGEECICECNNNDKADTECIATMQRGARSMGIPFELLIQGPSSNRFVRNAAIQFEQNADRRRSYTMERNKRSTVLIYKPTAAKGRARRSASPHLEWFSDFASTLVRPAPLGGHARADDTERTIEEPATATQYKRSADDRPWFAENTNLLIRPSPLFKRQSSDDENSPKSANDSEERQPFDAVGMMERLPQAWQQTLRQIQASALSDDFADTLRSKIKEGADALQNTFGNSDARQRQAKSFEEALRAMNLFRAGAQSEPEPTTTTATPANVRNVLPWFRPVRFLQRVQQVIN